MTTNKAIQLAEGYLARAEESDVIESYPLTQEGTYEFVSGTRTIAPTSREVVRVFQGRFEDAVHAMIIDPNYTGYYNAGEPTSWSHGYLRRVHPPRDHRAAIDTLLESTDEGWGDTSWSGSDFRI